jgi:tRNA (mo5U34)-methyltransferase
VTLQSTGSRIPGSDPVARRIRELAPWFHNLHLPSGHETAPDHPLLGDFPTFKWKQIRTVIPDDLAGWHALDVGCNAGFYSFELASRGATVVGIEPDEHYLRQAKWAARQYGHAGRVRFDRLTVYQLARRQERFDLVLFLGVLYHLRHPLLALDILAERVNRLLVLQTMTMPGEEVVRPPPDLGINERSRMLEPGWPKLAFVERRLAGDPTNWWAPNDACVSAMLTSAGLEIVRRPGHELYACVPGHTRAGVTSELDAATGRVPAPK